MKMKMLNNLQILFQMKRTIPSRLSQTKPRFSFTKRHRRRRNQTTEEQNYSEQRGNSKISQQSIKYKDHSHYHTNKPGTYVSAINGIEKETHKSKTHNMYSNTTNHRAKDSTPDYHKESFKTSEVPSAILAQ